MRSSGYVEGTVELGCTFEIGLGVGHDVHELVNHDHGFRLW